MTQHTINADTARLHHELANSPVPLLVDFTANWCGPCKGMAPGLELFAQERSGTIRVLKIDIDENKEEARSRGIRSVPTLMLFKEGTLLDTRAGAMTKAQLDAFVKPAE